MLILSVNFNCNSYPGGKDCNYDYVYGLEGMVLAAVVLT